MAGIWKSILKPRAWLAWVLLFALGGGLYALVHFGHMDPIREFLDSEDLSFTVGTVRFSLYLILKGLLTLVALLWITSVMSGFVERRISNIDHMRSTNKALVTKSLQILIYFAAALVGLDILGIDLTSFAIFGGAVGIGLGFGLQKITSNFISGIILLFEKSMEVDDLIELSDGTMGFVRNTGARATLIETFEGKEIMIPNEELITNRVTNWTYSNTKGRITVEVGVSYGADIEKARQLIIDAAKEHPDSIDEPAPQCYLMEFGDSSVNFLLFFWIGDVTAGRYPPKSDVMRIIWRKFKENDIEIPFPQRDLHIKNPEALK